MGLVRFLAFAVLLVALLVFVVVPVVASPLLTQMVRDMGLEADELEVSIESFDPSLFAGRTAKLRMQGTNVVLSPALVEELDLTFGQVAFVERTFESIRGELRGVRVDAGGLTLNVSSVQISGPAREASVAVHFNAQEAEEMLRDAARRAGIGLEEVRFVDGGVRVGLAGTEVRARVDVLGGALVLQPQAGPPMLLLQPAPSDPWRLSEAYVSSSGITVNGIVDATRLAQHLPVGP